MDNYNCDVCDNNGRAYFGYNTWVGYCDNAACKVQADTQEYNFALENVEHDAREGNTPDYNEVELII